MKKVLVTGAAGFIGHHLSMALLKTGHSVIGLDNMNGYYSVSLKEERLAKLREAAGLCGYGNFQFVKADLANREELQTLFSTNEFDVVVNLAAQAGVRYSIENPAAYIDSNVIGFFNILECCRTAKTKHLVYASSSSVYGMNTKQPFSTNDAADNPVSLYAATKKSNELMAHTYSHLYGIPTTGLRFFTVYGPMGRPDMAYYKFTKSILEGESIDVYNNGEMQRDFTYIDDIVEGIQRVMAKPPQPTTSPGSNAVAAYKIYNIGNNNPVTLRRFISAIETATGVTAKEKHLPMQAGDVPITYADIDELEKDVGYRPDTSIEEGILKFVEWYRTTQHKSASAA